METRAALQCVSRNLPLTSCWHGLSLLPLSHAARCRVLLTSGVLEAALDGRYTGAGKPKPRIPESPYADIKGERMLVRCPSLSHSVLTAVLELPGMLLRS